MRAVLTLFLAAAALALAGCELSRTVEHMDRAQCRAEAHRYPGGLEECEGIGRASERDIP